MACTTWPAVVPLTDANAPALEPYTRIRERDLAGRRGLFVAEGEGVVRVLATRSRFRVRSLLLEERRVAAMADVIAALSPDVPVLVVPQRVMDAVVGFPIHRGVLALGERGEPRPLRDVLERDLVVGMVGLTNHDNVGGIFRSAAAFGAGVLHDEATCDPLYRKAVRVSVGGALTVPFASVVDAHAMIDALETASFGVLALSARGDEDIDAAVRGLRRRALLVGTEGDGLPPDVLARARRVRIPMTPALDSLNATVAASIALYEATKR
jgi:tRNA G18 (ribose-2'-O)-methylase SpoU